MSAIDVTNTTEVYGDGAGSAAAGVKLLPGQIALSLLLFVVAGVAEIGGGWLVWVQTQPHIYSCVLYYLQHYFHLNLPHIAASTEGEQTGVVCVSRSGRPHRIRCDLQHHHILIIMLSPPPLHSYLSVLKLGVIPTWQPLSDFGRTYAIYGGFFVVRTWIEFVLDLFNLYEHQR
jgi:drug/metabolite transporter superfamily protein YnfA